MGEKYHYESGAIHHDHHKEINIGSVSEKALKDLIRNFLNNDAEEVAFEEVKSEATPVAKERAAKPKAAPAVQETFADRVKAIMHKAASKNGQQIETTAKGHVGAYIYNVDAEVFCKAMDDLISTQEEKLKEFLGGSMTCVQVTKVCYFIGHVVRMHLINDTALQMADIVFAFQDYYDNAQTVKAKLGDKKTTSEYDLLFGTFEGLLKKYKG